MNQQEKHQHFTWHGRASFFFYVEDGGFSSSSTSNASWRYSFWMDVVWTENMGENGRKKIQKKRWKRKEITVSDGRQTMDGWKAVIGTAWHSPVALMKWEGTPLKPSPPVFLFLEKISSNGFYLLLQWHPPFGWGIGCIVVGVSEAKSAFIGVPTGWLNREWNGFGGLDNFGLPL